MTKIKDTLFIGLSGRKRSGKTSVAMEIRRRLRRISGVDCEIYSFAHPLKVALHSMLIYAGMRPSEVSERVYGDKKEESIEELGGISARRMMQTLGTEWGRDTLYEDLWIDMLILQLAGRSCIAIIDDVRMDNEVEFIREAGGRVLRLSRVGEGAGDEHLSEQLPEYDLEVDNNGSVAQSAERIIHYFGIY